MEDEIYASRVGERVGQMDSIDIGEAPSFSALPNCLLCIISHSSFI